MNEISNWTEDHYVRGEDVGGYILEQCECLNVALFQMNLRFNDSLEVAVECDFEVVEIVCEQYFSKSELHSRIAASDDDRGIRCIKEFKMAASMLIGFSRDIYVSKLAYWMNWLLGKSLISGFKTVFLECSIGGETPSVAEAFAMVSSEK
jgi:hypothetical protein